MPWLSCGLTCHYSERHKKWWRWKKEYSINTPERLVLPAAGDHLDVLVLLHLARRHEAPLAVAHVGLDRPAHVQVVDVALPPFGLGVVRVVVS